MNRWPTRRRLATWGLTLAVPLAASALLVLVRSDSLDPANGEVAVPAQSSGVASAEGNFEVVMSVVTSPRCMNCHPRDDRPRQRDEQVLHLFNVERGADNQGGPVQTCSSCHHEENNTYSNVPGAPHWGLAPKSMGWLGLSDAEIARTLLDLDANGNRDHEALLEHMAEDPLVLWAWDPGGRRTAPPVSHSEFVAALEAWLDAGAPITGDD